MQSTLSKVVLRLASTTSYENSCVSLIAKRYKHTPSIKFTHGKINREAATAQHHQTAPTQASGSEIVSRGQEGSTNFARFKRRPMTEEEIRIINLGGAS